jgi:hypothetical protein
MDIPTIKITVMIKKLIIFVFTSLITIAAYQFNNNIYATPFAYLTSPLIIDEYKIGYTGIPFHLDNQTSGSIEMVTNVGGHTVTEYLKYTTDQRAITVSNSSIFANFNLMIPQHNNPTIINIVRINGSFPVQVIKDNSNDPIVPNTQYFGTMETKFSIGGFTFNKLNIIITIPEDQKTYLPTMYMYPSL